MLARLMQYAVLVAIGLYVLDKAPTVMLFYDECEQMADDAKLTLSLPPCNNIAANLQTSKYTDCDKARRDKATWPSVCTMRRLIVLTPPATVAAAIQDNMYLALAVALAVLYVVVQAWVTDRQNHRQTAAIQQMYQGGGGNFIAAAPALRRRPLIVEEIVDDGHGHRSLVPIGGSGYMQQQPQYEDEYIYH